MYKCYTKKEIKFVFENCLSDEYNVHELNDCLNHLKENDKMYIFDDGNTYNLCWEQDLECEKCHQDCFSDENIKQVSIKHLIRQRKMERLLCK